MHNEELRYFNLSGFDASSQAEDLRTDFSLESLSNQFIQSVLMSNGSNEHGVSDLTINPLSNGFNLEITGGGIYKLKYKELSSSKLTKSIILKSIPPFSNQQQQMLSQLEKIGERSFADILEKYPSNRLSMRELNSYQYLYGRTNLRVPKLHLGILNDKTEQSWIFMEDVSYGTIASVDKYSWKVSEVEHSLKFIANFHSANWGNDLSSEKWLGRWWTDRNNDFEAEDVTTYALERCVELHPDILDPNTLRFLRNYLKTRESYQQELSEVPQTVIHWDMGPHNMMLSHNPVEPIVFDWELTSCSVPQWDIAQFLMPNFGAKDETTITSMIMKYISYLPETIRESLDKNEFYNVFDLVVLDHFFRVCGPIVFSGENYDENSPIYQEWLNCLSWIKLKYLNNNRQNGDIT